jgi:AraC family transcriptional regulator of adaptative response / DNA-3-methyladenine glycosylase II
MTKETLTLELDYHPPWAWPRLSKFLADRAIPGVEAVEADCYSRTVAIANHRGWLSVKPAHRENALLVEASLSLAKALAPMLARVRNLFDLDAQPQLIEAHLSHDARLKPLVERQTGLRLPGAFDGFEMAVRAVLGQQISVRAARTLAGRITAAFGDPVVTPNPNLNRLSISARRLAQAEVAELAGMGLTRSRAECLVALAHATAEGKIRLEPGVDVESTIGQLKQLPGIGDWTAQYIAMRALRWPDAFPHTDLGVRKALNENSAKRILEMTESWRPWRAYAVMHLWSSLGGIEK